MKRKLIIFLGSFLVIYIFNFLVPRLMPGNPFAYTSSVSGEDDMGMSKEQMEKMSAYYGLDRPIGVQFVNTLKKNLRGDLGDSIYYKKSVNTVLAERLPWSLYIILSSLIISLVLGTSLALWGVRRKKVDHVLYGGLSILTEIPSFLIGILFLFLIAAKINWIPLSGNITPFKKFPSNWEMIKDIVVHSLLPVSAMVVVTVPQFYFIARASFLHIAKKPYVMQAKAKGLRERSIRYKYIFINGIAPIISKFFLSIGGAVGGTILIENVFAYPGLGKVLREAVMYRDFILIQGIFLLSTIMVLVSLLIADFINYYVEKEGNSVE